MSKGTDIFMVTNKFLHKDPLKTQLNSKTDAEKYRDLTKSQSVQFGTTCTKKGPGRYPVKAKQDR